MKATISIGVLATLTFIQSACSSPLLQASEGKRSRNDHGYDTVTLALNTDFPDPAFVKHTNGSWYAFGTNGNGERIQVAYSDDFISWSLLNGVEALPTLSGWEAENDHWAPDVFRRDDGKYVMYYSAVAKENKYRHCIGVAIADSDSPAGPYTPISTDPLTCPMDQGGAIDASGFKDSDGTRYILYKIDGNSIGHGGDCNNGVEPLVPTPIMLQQVQDDGFTPVGNPVQLIDRDESDGPLVEAPSMLKADDGTYLLFYSTHCFTDTKYDVRYATASNIKGPYTKTGNSLLASNADLSGPGGATVHANGNILFHGWCNDSTMRCMYTGHVDIHGTRVNFG